MELSFNVLDLVRQGGFAMYPLVACSFLALGVLAERAWIVWKVVRPVKPVLAAVMSRVARMELEEARIILRTARTPAAEVFAAALAPRSDNGVAPRSAESRLREMDRKRQELLHGL